MDVCSAAEHGAFHKNVAKKDRRQLVSSRVLQYLKVKNCPRDFKEDEEEIRVVQHYCSSHKILLVGEGDFSFSASLALAFASASNMVATSLDSRDFLYRNYKKAMNNLHELRSRGCSIIHGLDATEMAQHADLRGMLFDRIIFNFPHAGFFLAESNESQIRRHQMLVLFFLANAKKMIKEGGEIHVTHKSWGFFKRWNIEILALSVGLRLIEEVPFNFRDYSGYDTKYGFGGDGNFNCNPSKTYKFGHQSQTTKTGLKPRNKSTRAVRKTCTQTTKKHGDAGAFESDSWAFESDDAEEFESDDEGNLSDSTLRALDYLESVDRCKISPKKHI